MLDLIKTIAVCATIALVVKVADASITSIICSALVAIVLITHNDKDED